MFWDWKRAFLIVLFARFRLSFACTPLQCDAADDEIHVGETRLLQASISLENAEHATVANDIASVTATRTDVQIHTAMRLQPSRIPWKPAQQILVCGKGAVLVSAIVLLLLLLYAVCVGLPAKKPCKIKPEDNHMPIMVQCYLVMYFFLLIMTTDQYLPSLPAMVKEFNTDEQIMSFTLQGNWMVKAFLNLVVGVASDRLGRLQLLLGGNALMVVATFGCCCATDINWFLLCRLLQSLGESADVITMAIIRDYLPDDEKRATLMGLLMALIPIGPTISPVMGGLIANSFGWRLSFLFLACALALALCFGLFCLEESSPDVMGGRTVLEDARAILQDRHLVILLISSSMLCSAMAAASTNISYAIENEYGRTILTTSWFLAVLSVSCSLGGIIIPSCMPASNLQSCRITFVMVAVGTALVAVVAFSLTEHFESIFCLLPQNAVLLSPYIYLSTMAYTPAADFAGMMAAFEGCFMNVCVALVSMLGTNMTVLYGAKGLMLTSAGAAMGGSIIFWAGFGCDPPTWALDDDEKDQTSEKEAAPDSLSEEKPVALQKHAH